VGGGGVAVVDVFIQNVEGVAEEVAEAMGLVLKQFVAAVSAALCVATAGLWVRSCWIVDGWAQVDTSLPPNRTAHCLFTSAGGRLGWGISLFAASRHHQCG
jgi:hypothetical protein